LWHSAKRNLLAGVVQQALGGRLFIQISTDECL
jgi:hypothetical protein